MTTSGTYTFNLTRDDICKSALRRIKVIDQANLPTTDQLSNAVQALDVMVKSWRTKSVFLWTIDEIVQVLTASSIVVGTDGEDYKCIKSHTSATALNKPITGSDWATYWKDNSTTGAGAVWANTTGYTAIQMYTMAAEVIGVEDAFVRRDYYDTPLTLLTKQEYIQLGAKFTTGKPSMMLFDRDFSQSVITLYPVPDTVTDTIHMTVIKKLQDAGATGDNQDFTEEWLEALISGLAAKLAPDFDLPANEKMLLIQDANMSFLIAKGGDSNVTGMQIAPDFRR